MPVEAINGTTIDYEMTGVGAPLVLVHGAWVDSHAWDLVVPTLAQSFRVVTYDLRGHGRSTLDPPTAGTIRDDVADLAALIERLGLGPVHVAGNSSGACIALRLTLERPALVRSTLAHEPPADVLRDDDPVLPPMLAAIGAVRELLEAGDYPAAAERFVDQVAVGPGAWAMLPPPVQATFVRHAPAFLGQMNDPDATRTGGLLALDLDALRTVATPLLLSQGDHSPPMFAPIMDRLAATVPTAERRTIVDAGHVPHLTHPAAYTELVTQFIQQHEPTAPPPV